MKNLYCRWGVFVLAISTLGCGGLNLQLRNKSVQKPSNVALYFSVEDGDGVPAAGLTAESFKIYEDGQLISPFESKQTILNPEVAVVHYILLLLDLSGSITESGSMHSLVSAAAGFAEKVSKGQQIAVYGFDGGAKLIPLTGFTTNAGAVRSGLARVSTRKSKDPSTNLNGAVVESVKVLGKQLKNAKQPLRFATLVVFTDGTDRAHRVKTEEMYKALDEADVNVFAIGLGAEISTEQLSKLGRNGFVQAEGTTNIGQAFDEVAGRIEAAARKFYLLSYCSPSRAGKHSLRVEVSFKGDSGSLSHEFDAKGFRPKCDPKRKPNFSVGRVTLRPVKAR